MIKMILTVPHNFDAKTFGNIATAIVRDETENEYERREYDYDLGDFLHIHFAKDDHSVGTFNYYHLKNTDTYEVNADFVDIAHIAALVKLQKLFPQIEFHFENTGDGENNKFYYIVPNNFVDFKELFGNLN